MRGLEFAQEPRSLIGVPSPENESEKKKEKTKKFVDAMCRRSLELVGLAGGTLEDRIHSSLILKNAGLNPSYVYLSDWDSQIESLYREHRGELTFALHPYYGKRLGSYAAASKILDKFSDLRLILDTAHLYIAGDNILEVFKDAASRVASVHVKDWRNAFGRSFVAYSRGYTELGKGELGRGGLQSQIGQLVMLLRDQSFKGWLVLEQDYSEFRAEDSIRRSVIFLTNKAGIPGLRVPPRAIGTEPKYDYQDLRQHIRSLAELKEIDFEISDKLLFGASPDIPLLYSRIAEAITGYFSRLFDSSTITFLNIWELNPKDDNLVLKHCINQVHPKAVLKLPNARALPAVQAGAACTVPLDASATGKSMLVLPIKSNFNRDQVILVICAGLSEKVDQLPEQMRARLRMLDLSISFTFEHTIDWLRGRISHEVADLLSPCKTVRDANSQIQKYAKGIIRSERLSVFEVSALSNQVQCLTLHELAAKQKTCFRDLSEVETIRKAVQSGSAEFYPCGKGGSDQWQERTRNANQYHLMVFPAQESNFRQLIYRAVNRQPTDVAAGTSVGGAFGVTDELKLDIIANSAIVHLARIREAEQRLNFIRVLRHELGHPARSNRLLAAQFTQDLNEADRAARRTRETGQTKHIGELLQRSTEPIPERSEAADLSHYPRPRRASLFRWKYDDEFLGFAQSIDNTVRDLGLIDEEYVPKLEIRRTLIKKQIVDAAIQSVGSEIRQRNLAPSRIVLVNHLDNQVVFVDRVHFQRIFINLLSNAVKYSKEGMPKAFGVVVKMYHADTGSPITPEWAKRAIGIAQRRSVVIDVSDCGVGIPSVYQHVVWEFGERGVQGSNGNVLGLGLGLFFTRKLVEAHNGVAFVADAHSVSAADLKDEPFAPENIVTTIRLVLPGSVLEPPRPTAEK